MPGLVETFKPVIDEMTNETKFKLVNFLHAENANGTQKDETNSIKEPDNWWNIYLVSYNTLTSRGKPSSNEQLSHSSWSFGIFDESYWFKIKKSLGWRIAMNVKIRFKLQVTARPELHSLDDWSYQMMWLFSDAPEDPQDDSVMDKHSANTEYSAAKSLMNTIRTEEHTA